MTRSHSSRSALILRIVMAAIVAMLVLTMVLSFLMPVPRG